MPPLFWGEMLRMGGNNGRRWVFPRSRWCSSSRLLFRRLVDWGEGESLSTIRSSSGLPPYHPLKAGEIRWNIRTIRTMMMRRRGLGRSVKSSRAARNSSSSKRLDRPHHLRSKTASAMAATRTALRWRRPNLCRRRSSTQQGGWKIPIATTAVVASITPPRHGKVVDITYESTAWDPYRHSKRERRAIITIMAINRR